MRTVGYLSYIQEQNKARFIDESHILPFLYTLGHIFIPLCGRYLGFSEKTEIATTQRYLLSLCKFDDD